MNKYFLNILLWLTNRQIPDEILKRSFNCRIKNNKLTFEIKVKINPEEWRYTTGSICEKSKTNEP